ncbi:MAG: HlyC/CorC family transporter [Clostridia bacterium]|nr:HlyC/CorC family transporter [Clostridia bacterium]MBQ1553883.1 HlyC/CorC family transporter [Clostridia bacterium]MBQ4397755.1 HlyC/CorC family transporter [Clostridia bacterium]
MDAAVLALLIMLSAYFSATETAFSGVNKIRLKSMAADGNRKAARALKLTENFDKLLTTVLVGNNVVNILASSIATVVFTSHFGEAGVTVATLVMTVLLLIFSEITPKSMAKEAPERFAMASAPVIGVLQTVLTPVNWLFTVWKKMIAKLFQVKDGGAITDDELMTIVDEAQNEGGIGENQGELIRSAIEFSDLEVVHILTPRVNILAAEISTPPKKFASLFKNNHYSRIPVYKGTIDNIVGILHERDFYEKMYFDKEIDIASMLISVEYIPKNTKISELLRIFQHARCHMAVVVDEFGGTVGIITMEDILEELVGEIWDENDEIIREIERCEDGGYIVAGIASLSKVFEVMEIEEDEETQAVTISGWLTERMGKIPQVGEGIEFGGFRISVSEATPKRVMYVKIIRINDGSLPTQQARI